MTARKKALGFCGSKSGRDVNKLKELGLTLEEPESISVPGIKELPLTLECRIVYKQKQDINAMEKETVEKFYPQNVESSFTGSNRDVHIAYYGEIVNAYLLSKFYVNSLGRNDRGIFISIFCRKPRRACQRTG